MGFAEQLAARAAETQSHHQHSRNNKSLSSSSPPPRPGKIINRGPNGRVGSAGRVGGGTHRSTSPSLFADQLMKRKARKDNRSSQSLDSSHTPDGNRENRFTTPSSRLKSSTSGSSFADQISERSIETSTQSEPGCRFTSSLNAPPDSSFLSPKDQHATIEHIPGPGDNDDETHASTKGRPHRLLLTPIGNSSNNNNNDEDEDDEYSSLGFSLMDASTVSTVDEEQHGNEMDGGESKVTSSRRRLQPTLDESSRRQTGHTPKVQQQLQEEVPFQHNLSPIQNLQFSQQQQNNSELQSKLQRQLIKCQTLPKSKSAQCPVQCPSQTTRQFRESKERSPGISDNNTSPSNPIFGAWAQIESLKQRVCEAEERAMEESKRAELASYELRLSKEGQSFSRDYDDAATSSSSSITNTGALGEAGGAHPASVATDDERQVCASVNEQETTNHPLLPASRNANQEEIGINSRLSTLRDASQKEAAQRWKKRAVDAEERLAKEVERLERAAAATAASAAPQSVITNSDPQTPPQPAATATSRLEESDLIRLKNAEIDVLRSQIHRLERRIQEECERNEDLLRTTYHQHHDAPPLVVASEYMNSSPHGTATTEMDEFRLLRNEIRHLQYQLRSKNSHDGNRGTTSAYSTTGGSTLSSLDGNDEGEGVEEEDCNNLSHSSWGLCCIRRSRRGYGRVMKG